MEELKTAGVGPGKQGGREKDGNWTGKPITDTGRNPNFFLKEGFKQEITFVTYIFIFY